MDSWRTYNASDPDPGYFEFDWLSARHPDLYDRFALGSVGLMHELRGLVDLTGLIVCDVAAGTGRSAIGAAATANHVIAVDAYESVVRFGEAAVRRAGLTNVTYVEADRSRLPFEDGAIDAVTCAWGELDYREAFRILKPGGWLIHMNCPPGGLGGELAPLLALDFPTLIGQVGPSEWFEAGCPTQDFAEPMPAQSGITVIDDVRHVHDFTYVSQYEGTDELATMVGRIYGPRCAQYINDRRQSTLTTRQRISYCRIAK
jgi:SAM-dependent methyltransferase